MDQAIYENLFYPYHVLSFSSFSFRVGPDIIRLNLRENKVIYIHRSITPTSFSISKLSCNLLLVHFIF